MNILYIHSHDTGRYVQPYGYAVNTPCIQMLAEEGVLFRKAFTANPTCSPSRACLLTGQSAHANGMLGLAHRGFALNDYGKHLANTLKKEGYHTVLSGIQHLATGDEAWKTIGYDECLCRKREDAETAAAAFFDNAPKEPFFMSVGFFETHRTFPQHHPDEDPRYCMPPEPVPDTPPTREDWARYKQSARELDRKIGVVLEALERSGLAEDTLVVCTTDHGVAFPRMKCNLEDSGLGVMLIMRGPEGFQGGKVVDAMVSQVDIYPTICELLGIDEPDWLEGESFMPLITGDREETRDAVFAEVNYHASYEPMRAVRTQRWKYIRRYDYRTGPVLPNCDASPCKELWLEHDWTDHQPASEALYDLILDPNEKNNLINNEKYKHVLGRMKQSLHEWMEHTDDPLLENTLPLPESARLNPRDGLHPHQEIMDSGRR